MDGVKKIAEKIIKDSEEIANEKLRTAQNQVTQIVSDTDKEINRIQLEMKRKAEENYTIHYYSEVLNVLDPHQVYEELGENAVLLCWEKSGKFCHRHLVAEWFQKELGIEVNELK